MLQYYSRSSKLSLPEGVYIYIYYSQLYNLNFVKFHILYFLHKNYYYYSLTNFNKY